MASLTEEQIAQLEAAGATIQSNSLELSVVGMAKILTQFKELIEINRQLAKRNNDDLIKAVNTLTQAVQKNASEPTDLTPLVNAIIASRREPEAPEPVGYVFNMQRNSRGLLTSVKAEVDKPILN